MTILSKITENGFERLQKIFSFQDYVLLWIRAWVSKIFYDSGRTKAGDSFLEINDFQAMLFEEEYGISFIEPEILAQITLYAETFLPLAIFFGIGARFGALGLLGMTIFIQLFVYPAHFLEHAAWAVALGMVIMFGAGKISIDAFLQKKHNS